ncbi:hypothetical protein U1Q18_001602 [Sarracenia purpurea var. burkii]
MVLEDFSAMKFSEQCINRWVFEQEACAYFRLKFVSLHSAKICEEDECLHALAEGGPVPASVPWAVFTGFRA